MEHIKSASELRQRLREQYAYIHIYGPEFPAEDQTTLEREFSDLFDLFDQLRTKTRTKDQIRWLEIAREEADEAKRRYEAGDRRGGIDLIQRSEQHLQNRLSRKAIRATFVVGPDGTTEKV